MYKAKLMQIQNDDTSFQLYDITKNGKELDNDDELIKKLEDDNVRILKVSGSQLSDDFKIFNQYISFTKDNFDFIGYVSDFKELEEYYD